MNTRGINNKIYSYEKQTSNSALIKGGNGNNGFEKFLLSCVGNIMNFFDGDSTKDGVLSDTQQGVIGDCWLLSTLNSLNYTDKGPEIINNMLDYKDGKTVVHLGTGDYTVSDDELIRGKVRYAKGDEDAVIIELAAEKAMEEYYDNQFEIPGEFAEANITEESFSAIDGGFQDAAVFILTGKESNVIKFDKDKAEIDNTLDKKMNNSNIWMGITKEGDDCNIVDLNGEKVKLYGYHAYSIKNVDNDVVTVINPHDSSKEIQLSRQQIKDNFTDITYRDISED